MPWDSIGSAPTIAPIAPPVPPSSSAADPAAQTTSEAELSLAVIEPQSLPSGSEFGWSLSPNDADVGLTPLGDVLCQSGIGWVKFPFACTETAVPPTEDGSKEKKQNSATANEKKESAAQSLEPLINFSDRLGVAGVRLAGVLQPPRPGPRVLGAPPGAPGGDAGKTSDDLFAAEAFSRDPKTWYPSIEPVLARLATQIRFWQIGDDRDPGWIGCRDLAGIVSGTKTELDRIGQDLEIGIAWNLAAPLPMAAPSPKPDRRAPRSPGRRRQGPVRSGHRFQAAKDSRGVSCRCPVTKRSAMRPWHSAWTARNRRASLAGSCWIPCHEKAMARAIESPT